MFCGVFFSFETDFPYQGTIDIMIHIDIKKHSSKQAVVYNIAAVVAYLKDISCNRRQIRSDDSTERHISSFHQLVEFDRHSGV